MEAACFDTTTSLPTQAEKQLWGEGAVQSAICDCPRFIKQACQKVLEETGFSCPDKDIGP